MAREAQDNLKKGGATMPGTFRLQLMREGAARLDVSAAEGERSYSLRYVPPAGPSLRKHAWHQISPDRISVISKRVDLIFSTIAGRGPAQGVGEMTCTERELEDLIEEGSQFWTCAFPVDIRQTLTLDEEPIEFGLDSDMLQYTWELAHFEGEFLCLRRALARNVNITVVDNAGQAPVGAPSLSGRLEKPLGHVSILLISAPQPTYASDRFPALSAATTETRELVDCLADKAQVHLTVLQGRDACFPNVNREAQRGYDIVHFMGHAETTTGGQGLVLDDGILSADEVRQAFGAKPPLLFFLNACDTSRIRVPQAGGAPWLADSTFTTRVLSMGSYLLGSRWPLADAGAALFATTFYRALLREFIGPSPNVAPPVPGPVPRNASLGAAITEARRACWRRAKNDLAWASYVFYGDPRLGFAMTPWGRRAERDRILLSLFESTLETPGGGR